MVRTAISHPNQEPRVRLLLACGIIAALTAALPAAAQLKKGKRFDKGSSCLECHEEVGKRFRVTHDPLKKAECGSCHKPHGLVGALRLQKEEPDLCLDCHDAGSMNLNAQHAHPNINDCSTCHEPHGSDHQALLVSPPSQLCRDCHDGDGFKQKLVHAPAAGDCSSCHVRHGSDHPFLLKSDQEQLCGDCHDGQAVGFRKAHNGVAVQGADCGSCHPPHSGGSAGLLKASVHPELDCATCHEDGQGTAPPDGAAICLNCHDMPEKPANGSIHPPATAGNCLDCHDPHTSDHEPLLAASQEEICGACHEGIISRATGFNAHPVALECSTCHSGHSSSQNRLLQAEARAAVRLLP